MRAFATVAGALLALAYPFALYAALTRWGPRAVGLAVLALVAPRALAAALNARTRGHLAHALRVPLTVGALGLGAALARDARFVLAMPALVNLSLLAHFGLSLRGEVPLVERFARMQVDELSDAERAWCRHVTVAWCAFFALNALAAAALALAAPLSWWAVYTGGVAYALVGVMFAVEYVLRSHRFRRYGAAPHDRLMARLLPPRGAP